MRPTIAITMGDPAGIGPEIIAGAWSDAALHRICRPLVVGHPEILRAAVALRGGAAEVVPIGSPEEADPTEHRIPCLKATGDDCLDTKPGQIDPRSGQAAYDCILAAADLALSRRVDAIVTAPISKAALWQAGHRYPGHTELLAERCGAERFAMMLWLDRELAGGSAGLGVVHVTLHTALRNVFEQLTSDAVYEKIVLADEAMRRLAVESPRVAVCALNPHAGEDGLFGDEEQRIIAPAIERARSAGFNVTGALPADTLFVRARSGEFDAAVAMYHDQGHIALKLLGRNRAVNVTLGLPIIRTSVAHGTAFDIAWRGEAETAGLHQALSVATRLASPVAATVD